MEQAAFECVRVILFAVAFAVSAFVIVTSWLEYLERN